MDANKLFGILKEIDAAYGNEVADTFWIEIYPDGGFEICFQSLMAGKDFVRIATGDLSGKDGIDLYDQHAEASAACRRVFEAHGHKVW